MTWGGQFLWLIYLYFYFKTITIRMRRNLTDIRIFPSSLKGILDHERTYFQNSQFDIFVLHILRF